MMSGANTGLSLLGKRKKKRISNPNPLFSKWLAEWRDEAKEKGWKSEFIYSKALRSLQKYPLPLSSGKECKMLQNFGDKICKMLDDRLLQHEMNQSEAASFPDSVNSLALPSIASKSHRPKSPPRRQNSSSHQPKSSAPVHEISDSSDDETDLRTRASLHSALKFPRLDRHVAPVAPYNIQRTAVHCALDDSDEDVSIVEEESFLVSEQRFSDAGDMADLPKLPSLAAGRRNDRGKENVQNVNKNRSSNKVTNSQQHRDNSNVILDVGPTQVHVQEAHGDDDGGCGGDAEAGQAVPQQRARAGGRQREYVPAYRSGPYAVLLTFYRQAQDPDFRGFMTKAELCRNAQPLADKSFTVPDPGSRYTAWSSVSSLMKKGFLIKESNPAKFRLTDAGYELAHRLEEVERRQAGGGPDAGQRDGGGGGPGGGGAEPERPRTHVVQGQDQPQDTETYAAPAACSVRQSPPVPDTTSVHKPYDVEVGDSDDDMPALPSLAERLKPSLSAATACTSSSTASTQNRLQYWYVAEDNQLVLRKDQACVTVDDDIGVGFLVKVNYQQLLSSSKNYRLDITRPLGDDFVFAYLGDVDCDEEAQVPEPAPRLAPAADPTAPVSKLAVNSSKSPKPACVNKRTVHEISDSDPEDDGSFMESLPELPRPLSKAVRPENVLHSTDANVKHLSGSLSSATNRGPVGPSISVPKVPMPATALNRVPSLPESQDSVDSVSSVASSSASGETVPDFILHPGTFEVVLCVDNREFYGSKSSSKTLLPDLIKNGVTCDLRVLNVGDLLWVARERAKPGMFPGPPDQQEAVRRELVLNYVVERKRMDDLVSSMIGGRMKEQKFRLKHCGLQEKIILIESYGSMQHFSISEDRIRQSIANTQIIDGFMVKQTRDPKETAAYLTLMTRYLQSYFQNKTLRSCSRERLKETGLKFHLDDKEHMLMPFDHFNQASMKSKPLMVRELFGKQLIQLWGMSAEKAKAVVDRYPTPKSLFEAYMACSTDKERESLLANVKYGKNLRNLGIAVSRQVSQLYTSEKLT